MLTESAPTLHKKRLIVVCATLLDVKGRILMAQRPEGKPMSGLWEFPGGKLELNETPEQGLCRELEEELTIQVSVEDLLPFTFVTHEYEDFHLLMPVFMCSKWKGSPIAKEHSQIQWTKPEDMASLSILEADHQLVQHIIQIFS